MVANDFMDDEVEKLLCKVGVQMGIFGQLAQARDLLRLPRRVCGGEFVERFKGTNSFGAAKALCQHGNKGCVNIVYAAAEVLQGFGGARLICHGDQGLWLQVKYYESVINA